MNIFVTSDCPTDSAISLDDKRVIKMILESAQMLSTAINLSGGQGPYKSTHANHPCTVWARSSRDNYWWLKRHFDALCQAYYDRFNKKHKCLDHIVSFAEGAYLIPQGPLTSFSNCTEFKEIQDVHEAYRLQMNKKWKNDKRTPKWTNAKSPDWKEQQ